MNSVISDHFAWACQNGLKLDLSTAEINRIAPTVAATSTFFWQTLNAIIVIYWYSWSPESRFSLNTCYWLVSKCYLWDFSVFDEECFKQAGQSCNFFAYTYKVCHYFHKIPFIWILLTLGPSSLQRTHPTLLKSLQLVRQWTWAAEWNVRWSLKTILCLKLRPRIWQEFNSGNKESYTVINWSCNDIELRVTALTQHASLTQVLQFLSSGCLPDCLRAHFRSERKWWWQCLVKKVLNFWRDRGKPISSCNQPLRMNVLFQEISISTPMFDLSLKT